MSSHVYTLIGEDYDMSVYWCIADLKTVNYHTETFQPMSLGRYHWGRIRASLLPGKTNEFDLLMSSHVYTLIGEAYDMPVYWYIADLQTNRIIIQKLNNQRVWADTTEVGCGQVYYLVRPKSMPLQYAVSCIYPHWERLWYVCLLVYSRPTDSELSYRNLPTNWFEQLQLRSDSGKSTTW